MLTANHKTLSESSQRVSGLLPITIRTKMAIVKGNAAVTTRTWGLSSFKAFPGGITGVYRRVCCSGQDIVG